MNNSDREANERLHTALQAEAPNMLDAAGEDAAVLTTWITVCEWMSPSGEKFLSRWQSVNAPGWQIRGLLHEALFNWPAPEEDDDA